MHIRGHGCVLFGLFLASSAALGFAQTGATIIMGKPTIAQVPSPLSLDISPAFDLPIGGSSQYFSYGGSMDLGLNYHVPRSILYLLGGIEYGYTPVQAATSLSLAGARAGAGIQLPLSSGIAVLVYGAGGYYFGSYNDFSANASDPFVAGGVGLRFSLGSGIGLEVGAQYKNYLGLYQGISAGAGMNIALGNLGGSVEMPSLDLRPAFPLFYKYYDDHPIGTMELKSNLKVPASDIKAQVYIKEYMDAPKTVSVPGTLAPGESRKVDLYALFTDKVLGITEGTKVAAEITVSYTVEGQSYENRKIETMSLMGRNAMTWDDNRKAAAYVTSKDPGVLNFARSVSSYIRAKENRSICDNLQAAIAFHEALDLYGMNYTPNPKTPYDQVSQHKDVIDFLQFPRETFQYKAGDCSDLSILYASLFQAVGIDAAFITVPGHIFIAVDTCMTPEQAPKELIPTSQFIAYKNHAWIPIEITAIHDGFMRAWQLGAKEWTENNSSGQAGFYPIQEAWSVYQPVGLTGTEATVTVPQSDLILHAYLGEVQKYLDTALAPMVATLQGQSQGGTNLVAMNNLGVLYAKYGQSDKAEQTFKQILRLKAYLPTILNLGHLYYSNKDWKNALALYQQAGQANPNDPHTLLALARVNQEMQNYPDAKSSYEKLKAVNPTLASQFAYLGEATTQESGARAADIEHQRSAVIWETDQ